MSRIFSTAIVDTAHTLGMDVVAVGVETAEQRRELSVLGCDYSQGSFFADPVGGLDVARLIESRAGGSR